uniref:Uncharacterized protein n=1 Tax=Cucumis melo TaxID=3656 RepID=A0A9I9E566_CUCME
MGILDLNLSLWKIFFEKIIQNIWLLELDKTRFRAEKQQQWSS